MPFAKAPLYDLRVGPPHRRRRSLFFWIALACCLTSCSPAEAQDYQHSFRKGILALDQKNWQAAERWFASAIQQQPTSSTIKVRIYGVRLERYLPYFYLGQARQKQGNCAGALTAWSQEIQFGVIKGNQVRELQSKMIACGGSPPRAKRPPVLRPPPTTPPPPPRTTRRPRPRPLPPPTTTPTPTPTPRPTPSQHRKPFPNPPVTTPSPSVKPKPAKPIAGDVDTVRQEVLKEKNKEAQACLNEAERWVAALDKAIKARRWRPNKERTRQFANARTTLATARFRLGQGKSENDLKAVGKAKTEACNARAALANLGRGVKFSG